ncbi:E3 ubiquitin-protein ligase TRIM71-like [Mytilus edulis]|uniref:E3 ubiquitin-protein ligase TRIM71-like n=1 Tax=Mytilus edulis TaxID=6550 RepID=UPI0039EFF65F
MYVSYVFGLFPMHHPRNRKMASSFDKLCGPCEARHTTEKAAVWCIDCDDGLCLPCLEHHKVSKASNKHQTIPVSKYAEVESVSALIKLDCEEHNQKLTFFCQDHFSNACALCIPEKHKQCTSIKPIEQLAHNAKTSTELFDLEKGLKELSNSLAELNTDRQRNIEEIRDQRKNILAEIKSLRKQIDTYLDVLESDLLKQLESLSDQNISEIDKLLSKLKDKETQIKSLGESIHQIKETLSDVQVFLATKSVGEKLHEEQEWISALCDQDVAKESILELSTDSQLTHLLSDLKHFGVIKVVRKTCQIKVGAWEQQRAQLNVPMPAAARDIDDTKLELLNTIKFDNDLLIQDCAVVNDGRMIFTVGNTGNIVVYSGEGQLLKLLEVGVSPFGLAVISTNTLAATCLFDKTINIVNIDDGVVKQKIKVGKPCLGLSYHNTKLYVIVKGTGIVEFDLGGNLIRTISVDVASDDCYLTSYKDRFCYTCYKQFIACCDSNGREIWRQGIADSGVAADNYGNYFAAHYREHTLNIISSDGKKTKQLLTSNEGLNHPQGIFFDSNNNKLLVANRYKKAMLYRII